MNPIRIVLIEDHTLVRDALAALLSTTADIELLGAAGDGESGIALALDVRPDLVLLDYDLPDMDGAAVIQALRARSFARVLVISSFETPLFVRRVLEAGAHGFVGKTAPGEGLADAIRRVHARETVLPPALARRVIGLLDATIAGRNGIASLSPREFEMVRLIGNGLSVHEAAVEMGISLSAASTYRARAMKKLGVDSTAELVRFAIESGIAD